MESDSHNPVTKFLHGMSTARPLCLRTVPKTGCRKAPVHLVANNASTLGMRPMLKPWVCVQCLKLGWHKCTMLRFDTSRSSITRNGVDCHWRDVVHLSRSKCVHTTTTDHPTSNLLDSTQQINPPHAHLPLPLTRSLTHSFATPQKNRGTL